MKVCIDKGTDNAGCCKAWAKGIRTINNQYPDDNREFGILEGTGILITPETAGIRITCTVPAADTITAGDNIDISPGGNDELVISLVSDPVINGDIQINGNIIQNGSAYETHAEKVFTTNDYIVTRDGAISALSAGDYSGFQVKKYDGTNDGRLVIDNAGVARVGDVGDEQPLLTRDESADLTDGESLVWDATNQKAITETIPAAINTALAGKMNNDHVTGEGTVTNGCSLESASNPIIYDRVGRLCTVVFAIRLSSSFTGQYTQYAIASGLPKCITGAYPYASAAVSVDGWDYNGGTRAFVDINGILTVLVRNQVMANRIIVGSVTYITLN